MKKWRIDAIRYWIYRLYLNYSASLDIIHDGILLLGELEHEGAGPSARTSFQCNKLISYLLVAWNDIEKELLRIQEQRY